MTLRLRINGTEREISSDPGTPLLFVLREELGLKGAKLGCGLEQCGACMVLVDGEAVPCCASPAETFAGKDIVTVEGLADHPVGQRVQKAFVRHSAAQCGYCTAGLVVAATALLNRAPQADREAVKQALAPNLCRCGSHPRVLRAIAEAQG